MTSTFTGPGLTDPTFTPRGVDPSNLDPHAVTISGIVLDPSYGPQSRIESLANLERDVPPPGQYPFTRGLFPEGYRTRLWTMRQFAGFGSADDTNRRFKYLLEAAKTSTKANTGLSTA
ncbi:MAG: hypothetical protein KDA21_11135, partial [Phycisphaerales bacterium]|nr:hypothetical protein [Phycisphaerales bacterium]